MKLNRVIFLIVIVLIVLSVCWLRSTRQTQDVVSESTTETTESFAPQTSDKVELRNAASNQNTTVSPKDFFAMREEQMKQAGEVADNEWRAPIDFFGKVVDENDNPVAESTISFSWNNLSGTQTKGARSDNQGFFSLRGEQGKFLSIKVSKTGFYEFKPEGEGFFFAGRNENFIPNINDPIVFRLHKKGKAESLIAIEFPGASQVVQFKRDGTPVEIDLLLGIKVLTGGHVKMEFWGDPIERTTRVFSWKFHLSVVGGGITEATNLFPFEAPETGYRPQIAIDMPASMERWGSDMKQRYFIKLPNGNYGRIEIHLMSRNGVYRIHSFINPSGSRNLEYDEAIQPKPTVHE